MAGRPRKGETAKGVAEKSQRLRSGIDARLTYLVSLRDAYYETGELPTDAQLPVKANHECLRKWDLPDIGIYSIGSPSTYRDRKDPSTIKKTDTLKEIAEQLLGFNKKETTPPKVEKEKLRKITISELKKDKKELEKQLQTYKDELILLRTLYNKLIEKLESQETLREHDREAIKRYRMLYGTLRVIPKSGQPDAEY